MSTQSFQDKLLKLADTNAICALAGALMPLCFAPFHLWWLCWILLIPLLVACQQADPAIRIQRGGLFGIMYFGIGCYWLTQTLVTEVHFSWMGALAANLIIAAACTIAPMTFCWLAGYTRKIQSTWFIFLPALWVLIEDIRFQAFGGGPWMSLGQSQLDSPLSGFYPILGEVGSSGVVIAASYMLLMIIKHLNQPALSYLKVLPLFSLFLFLSFGQWSKNHEWTVPFGSEITIAMVQPATSQREKMKQEGQFERLDKMSELSQPHLGKTSLIIWPETVVTLKKNVIEKRLMQLNKSAISLGSTLLIGGFEASLDQHLFNSVFTIGNEGGQSYRKRHLVPFGEYVPSFLSFLDSYVPGDQYRSPGRKAVLIAINGHLLGVSICWEGAFSRDILPLVRDGARVIINVANEAWFAGSSLPLQNLDVMRIRALETGRATVRVANMGAGAIINSKGDVQVLLLANRAGSVKGVVQPRIGATPFVKMGADFILLISFVLVMGVARLAYKNKL